jgi:hypothetical protein
VEHCARTASTGKQVRERRERERVVPLRQLVASHSTALPCLASSNASPRDGKGQAQRCELLHCAKRVQICTLLAQCNKT